MNLKQCLNFTTMVHTKDTEIGYSALPNSEAFRLILIGTFNHIEC